MCIFEFICAVLYFHIQICWLVVVYLGIHSSMIYLFIYLCIYLFVGWLWLVGSIRLKVSCAQYCLFYRVLLQKRPITYRCIYLFIYRSYNPFIYVSIYWFILFCKRAIKRGYILQKRSVILRSLLIVATPYPYIRA